MTNQHKMLCLADLESKLISGRIKRRDFIKGLMVAGFSLSASSLLFNQAHAATPKKGGLFRVASGQGSTTATLDSGLYDDEFQIMTGYAFRGHLTEFSSSNELVGDLAEGWESSDDVATWAFDLRRGVEFHNGKTFNSADVVASLNHHRGEASKSKAKSLMASVTDITADGPYKVVIRLNAGNADFPTLLSDYHLAMMPSNGEGGVDWKSGIGTGGYQIESYTPGVEMNLKRFPNYYKKGMAHFDAVKASVINDVVARTSALRSNAIDAMDRCDLKTVNLLKKFADIEVDDVSSAAHVCFPMNTTMAPFDNKDVRLAMKYAINRQEILSKIFFGFGTLGNDHPVGRSVQFFADKLPQRQYDPDKAKYHLKQAGMNSLKVKLYASDIAFPGAVDLAILYKESASACGIDLEVVNSPADGFFSEYWMKKPFVTGSWGARPTADMVFTQIYAATAPWNETFWKNERFNKLLVAARKEYDTNKRREMYFEMQKLVG
ncbi:MAG: ABC transporter substrate-binding protein, partial [Thermodesulfobacteriota bacterium]